MRFDEREYLIWLAVLVPLAVGLLVAAWRARLRALARFGNLAVLQRMIAATSRDRQRFKMVLMVLVLVFLLLALARPQWGRVELPVTRRGIDILIAIDTSKSMLAEDIGSGMEGGGRSRLAKAIEEVQGLIDHARGDRIGLVAFAGKAQVVCPLTLHYGALSLFLNDISPYTISVGGTGLAEAIRVSTGAFERTERKYKALILITDGEETVETRDDVLAAAEAAQAEGIRVYTIGVGTAGTPIPEMTEEGELQFKRDREGNVVYTKPDEDLLRRVSQITNGKYLAATPEGLELEAVYEALARLEEKQLQDAWQVEYYDRYQYFIGLALLCLVWEFLLSERKRQAARLGGAA